jgi:hypothetical protein
MTAILHAVNILNINKTIMKEQTTTLWKSLSANLVSHGGFTWEVGKWEKHKGDVKACNSGFHASVRAINAMQYVNCEHLALVEVKGKSDLSENDKQCWSEMRLLKVYNWKKEDSVALSIYAAELVIDLYEKQYPNDDRPRKAIEAARKYLENPTEAAAEAAWAAARAAEAAEAAEAAWAAWAAARAAEAAEAAEAAWAAWVAARAVEAAGAAAWAAFDETLDKVESWIQNRINQLEEYEHNNLAA